ncbi:STAS domain-containing protein [Streptomyces sp. NPDC058657]|uniref:STAS domain-containing protein n=1 Tax=unclassified Streptomyces TaxID=2593676 RepID=UPI00365AD77D
MRTSLAQVTIGAGQLLVLDLAGLEFCDSSGISAFLSARNLANEQGGDIALVAVPANTARILGITGLDQIFTIHPDTTTATTGRHVTTRSPTARSTSTGRQPSRDTASAS